jgi:2,4-dienoyl-CoA reductase-like NADH-dependent reductase (Old Yellow Enzyme family)
MAESEVREAFFIEFANAIRSEIRGQVPLMVTGGFRSRRAMEAAVAEGYCDLVGIARPSVIAPAFPKETILNLEVDDDEAKIELPKITAGNLFSFLDIKFVGAGVETVSSQDHEGHDEVRCLWDDG